PASATVSATQTDDELAPDDAGTPTVTPEPTTDPTVTATPVTPTPTQKPKPTATPAPKPTTVPTQVVFPPTAVPTATAKPKPTATATAEPTVTEVVPTATVPTSGVTTPPEDKNANGGGGLPLFALVAIIVVGVVGGVGILLYVMMRRTARDTRSAGLAGMRRGGVTPAGFAASAVGSSTPATYNAPQGARPAAYQQQVQAFASPSPVPLKPSPRTVENVAPAHASYSVVGPQGNDAAAVTQAMQGRGPVSPLVNSDMNPLTLDFQRIVDNSVPGATFSTVAASSMGVSSMALPPLPPLDGEQKGSEAIEEEATLPVRTQRAAVGRPAESSAGFLDDAPEKAPPAPPGLPWDLQPGLSETAQDDPLLGALKRQVQVGLFSVPDREDEGKVSPTG
ncbi:MAG: hypothetical protein J2P36_33500, partial [Ktedonobacteraceae bacterium]|nr:hypothetical protein [Ktedonobacteraceae bacterium]